jgi:hypothetical protein
LTDITPDTNAETPNGAEVKGLLGVSESGSSGFFVARGVLGEGLAQGAEPGRENLYRFEISGGGIDFEFVADLGPEAEQSRLAPTAKRGSRVDADGSVVVFSSTESLTGYPNEGAECTSGVPVEVGPCSELFRFEAGSPGPVCISCSPTGAPPAGSATFRSREMFSKGGQAPEAESAVVFTRNLSEDGDQVFFQTPQALVPGDTNGATECVITRRGNRAGFGECQDVYEWEAAGAPGGSCTHVEINGGCLYLLSSGQSDQRSYFAGASRDGSNVYLLTTSQLTPSDDDLAADFYDASVGGGLPAQQAALVGSCAGEGCLGPPSAIPPPSTAPASAGLLSPGNPKAKHAKKKKRKVHRSSKHHAKGKKSNHRRVGKHAKHGSGRGGSK